MHVQLNYIFINIFLVTSKGFSVEELRFGISRLDRSDTKASKTTVFKTTMTNH